MSCCTKCETDEATQLQRYGKCSRPNINISAISSIDASVEDNALVISPMDFKMHRDGKGVNPREHR
ncbi:hypothetical protein EAE92_14245 [Photorhabdus hainanensis]|nr:hypothetical protein [Photorhabdus hainanensis]